MELTIKKEFKEKYSKLTNYKEYEEILKKFLRQSFRVNTLKTSVAYIKKNFEKNYKLDKIPWCEEGFWITGERRDLGNLYEHQIGSIYIQEAASMLPPIVLGAKKNEIVLDLSAAPGSKTTQISAMMKNTGLIMANDVNYYRMMPLVHNLQRCGVLNTVTNVMDGRNVKGEFDKVLFDAPCSGVGTIRGNTGNSCYTMETYNIQKIKTLSGIQKKILLNAYKNLKNKEVLVYSTCSLEPEEDEEVIQFLLNETDAKLMKIDLKLKSEINLDYGDYSSELKKCIKLWPQFYDTEGFFVAKVMKP